MSDHIVKLTDEQEAAISRVHVGISVDEWCQMVVDQQGANVVRQAKNMDNQVISSKLADYSKLEKADQEAIDVILAKACIAVEVSVEEEMKP